MNKDRILHTPSMPLAAPSYPRGPYRFIDREYLIVSYLSDPDAIREALPEPLQPSQKPRSPQRESHPVVLGTLLEAPAQLPLGVNQPAVNEILLRSRLLGPPRKRAGRCDDNRERHSNKQGATHDVSPRRCRPA